MTKVIKATFTEENRPIKVGDLVYLVHARSVVPVEAEEIDEKGGYMYGDHINLGGSSVNAGYATEESEPVPESSSATSATVTLTLDDEVIGYVKDLADEVEALGKDVAQLDEKFDVLLDEIYAKDKSDFTSAERLQYAIDLGASEESVRTYFESLIIANGELTEVFSEASAKVRLEELREIIDVYQTFRRKQVESMLDDSLRGGGCV